MKMNGFKSPGPSNLDRPFGGAKHVGSLDKLGGMVEINQVSFRFLDSESNYQTNAKCGEFCEPDQTRILLLYVPVQDCLRQKLSQIVDAILTYSC